MVPAVRNIQRWHKMMIDAVYKPHSADVRLTLRVNSEDYELAKVGPNRVFLRKPVVLPSCDAELIISVDGRISSRQIFLPNGASVTSKAVETR